MQKHPQYTLLALMLLGLLLFYFIQLRLWGWITHDLRGGDWACALARGITTEAGSPLVGIEGRFLWTASLLLQLLSMALVLAVSAYSLVQRLPRRRLGAGLLLGLGLAGLVAWIVAGDTPDHRQFMGLAAGTECGFVERPDFHFNFSRYLLLLFQSYYPGSTLDFLGYIEGLMPALLLPCNLLLTLGLLATVWSRDPAACTRQVLAERIARYRLLLLLAAALFTAIALYNMSEFRWFAQVLAASDPEGAGLLRSLQRGLTLYLGTTNSLALALFFLPTGWLLARQAGALSEREAGLDTRQAREEWLSRHQLRLFSGPLMQLGAVFAPLLVSGGMTLLQQALNG